MAGEGLSTPVQNHTLMGLVEEFLTDAAKSSLPKTVKWQKKFLDDFASRYPRLKPTLLADPHRIFRRPDVIGFLHTLVSCHS